MEPTTFIESVKANIVPIITALISALVTVIGLFLNNKNMKSQNEKNSQEAAKIQKEAEKVEAEIARITSDTINSQMQHFAKLISDLRIDVQRLEDANSKQEMKIADLMVQNEKQRVRINELERSLAEVKQEKAEAIKENYELRKQIANQEVEIGQLRRKVAALEAANGVKEILADGKSNQ